MSVTLFVLLSIAAVASLVRLWMDRRRPSTTTATACIRLTCEDCARAVAETWDGRCGECFYVYTGGDLGHDDMWHLHVRANDGNIVAEVK